MSRFHLAALALVLSLSTSCSTWHYRQSQDRGVTYGRSGSELSIAEGPIRVKFAVPPGWKVISSLDEPLDWDYAADAPAGQFGFGVRLAKDPHPMTTDQRYHAYLAYLANVWNLYDPKVRMKRAPSFTLKDGRSIQTSLYSSAYWGHRLVATIPEHGYSTTFEFSDPSAKSSMDDHKSEIQKILGSYSSVRK